MALAANAYNNSNILNNKKNKDSNNNDQNDVVANSVPCNFVNLCNNHQFGLINPRLSNINDYSYLLVPYNSPVVLNPCVVALMDEERSISLFQFMVNEGLVPSAQEEEKRRNVIRKLRRIVLAWIKKVAWQRRLPRQQIAATYATILTYGSYGLGVHGSESDIDALCVGPFFATIAKDFFVLLRNMLKNRPEVSEILCIKDAKVPLMRFKFEGISIDLPYAQLKLLAVPENVDVVNPYFLKNVDETSWKSLSGVRANKRILQLVPNVEKFRSLLRCVKLWAKRRGLYGNLFGFLGGVHMAILAAYMCQVHPSASLNSLITRFFETFAYWPWPSPVMLQDGTMPPPQHAGDMRSFMPICLPCSPYGYCHSNVTKSTFYKVRAELLRGYHMTRDLLRPDFDWGSVFEPFAYSKKYTRFIKIFLSARDQDQLGDWVGWVKSRIRCLLIKLEDVQGFCDPNPTEYSDAEVGEPNVVFYWGLHPGTHFRDIESVEVGFMKSINNSYKGHPGRLELCMVEASQLPKNVQFDDTGTNGIIKSCWKIPEFNQPWIPFYTPHQPHYFFGYVATNREAEYPSSGS